MPERTIKPRGLARRTLCVESGEVYPSSQAAARAMGLGLGAIKLAIGRGTRAAGFHWKYVDDHPSTAQHAGSRDSWLSDRSRPLRCLESNDVFSDLAEAAGFTTTRYPAGILLAARSGQAFEDLHWAFADQQAVEHKPAG